MDEIKRLLQPFCDQHLNDELTGYVMKLCDKLGRKRTISITRGRPEIWAASIVYVIARLNFLFDKSNPFFLTTDTICEFFGVKKSTVASKASFIEKVCNISLGEKELCSSYISDMFTFYETPEGFILPKSMLPDHKIEIVVMDENETKEFETRLTEDKRRKERKDEEERKQKRAADFKKRHENQADLFGGS